MKSKKDKINLVVTFPMCAVQFIIGVLLISDHANLHTVGWYYIGSSSFLLLVAVIGVLVS